MWRENFEYTIREEFKFPILRLQAHMSKKPVIVQERGGRVGECAEPGGGALFTDPEWPWILQG